MTLREYLLYARKKHSELARAIPCTKAYISMLASGKANPSWRMAQRIEEVTDGLVPAENWYKRKEEIDV